MTLEQKITVLKYQTSSVQLTIRERAEKFRELKKLERTLERQRKEKKTWKETTKS